jgi:hypothetical protein
MFGMRERISCSFKKEVGGEKLKVKKSGRQKYGVLPSSAFRLFLKNGY